MMKKRILSGALALTLALGVTACGSKKPSLDEVEEAIAAGHVTMEDALEKGWITQEWVDSYMAENSVEASDKVSINALDAFSTPARDGSTYTEQALTGATFFAFLDPAAEECAAFYQELVSAYEGVKEAGAEIVVAVKGDLDHELFADAPFTVIHYNDELKAALKQNAEMVEGGPCVGVWIVNGSALSAWYSSVTAEDLPGSAAAFAEMANDLSSQDGSSDNAAAIMG